MAQTARWIETPCIVVTRRRTICPFIRIGNCVHKRSTSERKARQRLCPPQVGSAKKGALVRKDAQALTECLF